MLKLRAYTTTGSLLVLFSALAYYLVAYHVERTEFDVLFFSWAVLFAAYLLMIRFSRESDTGKLIAFSFIFRLIFILAVPALSNDFYRFIWDARLMLRGVNPFEALPGELINTQLGTKIDAGWILFEGMGTLQPDNYSCYPPVNQFAFLLGSFLTPNSITGSIVGIRLIIVLADLGIVFYGKRLLQWLGLPVKNILIYVLNPLVIVELTGNLHFEGLMLLFIIIALYFLLSGRSNLSAVFFALGVSVKLIPLIFLPLLYKNLGLKKLMVYASIVAAINILLFIPFMSPELLANFWSSLDLYFRNFEFNASIYYVVRATAYEIVGWNIIQTAGPALAAISVFMVLLFALLPKNQLPHILISSMILVLSFHYFLSTTVMPWYIVLILGLSVFYPQRFIILWSFTIILSYQAYSNPGWRENLLVIFVEYLPVYLVLIYEWLKGKAYEIDSGFIRHTKREKSN